MKLKVNKTLSGGVFKVAIEFKDYEVFEENLMEDFGVPELYIPTSTWGATATVAGGEVSFTEIEKDKEVSSCSIDITNDIKVSLDNLFKAEFSVKVSDIESSDLVEPLDTVVQMAKAKCELFIEVIKQEAKSKMDELRSMKTDFEAAIANPKVIKI